MSNLSSNSQEQPLLSTCRYYPRLTADDTNPVAQCPNPAEITLKHYAGMPLVLCRDCASNLLADLEAELSGDNYTDVCES